MSPARFYLRDPRDEVTTIYLRYNYTINGKKQAFKYALRHAVRADHWIADEMRLKVNVRPRTAADRNRSINDDIERHADALARILVSGPPTKARLIAALGSGDTLTLVQEFERLIRRREDGLELTKAGKPYAPKSIDSYRATLAWMRDYDAAIRPDEVTMAYYYGFVARMNRDNLSANHIGGRIKHIKMLLRYLYHAGRSKNLIFDNPAFKKLTETADTVYLNTGELERIAALELDPTLDRVRDLFLLGCYTGLRFQDYGQLYLPDGEVIKIITRKTSATVFIPVHPVTRRILEKYGGRAPATMSNQKMNHYLKDIAIKAGLTQRESFRITRGGQVQRETFEKWEKITTHTARRSFATNLYLAGVDTLSIMRITGHTTEDSFLKYIKVTKQQSAERMAKHPFFTSAARRAPR